MRGNGHFAAGAVEAEGEAAAVVDQIEGTGGFGALVNRAETQFVFEAVAGAHQFGADGMRDFVGGITTGNDLPGHCIGDIRLIMRLFRESGTCSGGNTDTVMGVTLKNVSGKSISNVSVTAGKSTIAFTGLDFQKNDELLIEHTAEGLIRLRIHRATGTPAYVSIMANRTPASADDLYVSPGNVSVSWKCDRACNVTATWRGRFK